MYSNIRSYSIDRITLDKFKFKVFLARNCEKYINIEINRNIKNWMIHKIKESNRLVVFSF